tara:strand:+ start:1941 stop:2252 length:312 start_codon:yes stop_codon:yes gene_type:complete
MRFPRYVSKFPSPGLHPYKDAGFDTNGLSDSGQRFCNPWINQLNAVNAELFLNLNGSFDGKVPSKITITDELLGTTELFSQLFLTACGLDGLFDTLRHSFSWG